MLGCGSDMHHHNLIEISWTAVPGLFLGVVEKPRLPMFYSLDEVLEQAHIPHRSYSTQRVPHPPLTVTTSIRCEFVATWCTHSCQTVPTGEASASFRHPHPTDGVSQSDATLASATSLRSATPDGAATPAASSVLDGYATPAASATPSLLLGRHSFASKLCCTRCCVLQTQFMVCMCKHHFLSATRTERHPLIFNSCLPLKVAGTHLNTFANVEMPTAVDTAFPI